MRTDLSTTFKPDSDRIIDFGLRVVTLKSPVWSVHGPRSRENRIPSQNLLRNPRRPHPIWMLYEAHEFVFGKQNEGKIRSDLAKRVEESNPTVGPHGRKSTVEKPTR